MNQKDIQMKQTSTVFCSHLTTENTKLTNASGTAFGVIDSTEHAVLFSIPFFVSFLKSI